MTVDEDGKIISVTLTADDVTVSDPKYTDGTTDLLPGPYDIVLSASGIEKLQNANLDATFGTISGTLVVTAAAATAELGGSDSKTYDGKAGTIDATKYTITLSNGETYTLTDDDLEFSSADPTNVGTYDVQLSATGVANLNKVDSNYTYTATSVTGVGKYTINPISELTSIVVDNKSSDYGNSSPVFTITTGQDINNPGNLTNDDFTFVNKDTGKVVDGVPTDVGDYEVSLNASGQAKVEAANPNYSFSADDFVSGTYTINDVITHSEITVSRTIHYTGAGLRTPADVVQTIVYDVATSKATGKSAYTATEAYAAVPTKDIAGFTNSGDVSAWLPATSTTMPADSTVTVTYTPTDEIGYSHKSLLLAQFITRVPAAKRHKM